MTTYFSTFVSGAEKIVEKTLKKRGKKHFDIDAIFDGLVIYRSCYTERDVRQHRFFNNSFVLLDYTEGLHEQRDPVAAFLNYLVKSKKWSGPLHQYVRNSRIAFKLVVTRENQTVAPERKKLLQLESTLTRKHKGLSLSVEQPDYELWAMVRGDGLGLFGIRITYPYAKRERTKRGELRNELGNILALASSPSPKETVLDPFAGYGGIVMERAKGFPYKKLIAVEKDPDLAKQLRTRVKKNKKQVEVISGDAFDLKQIKDESIDTIITDPPWGLYQELEKEPQSWYGEMLQECTRVLKPKGKMVVLVGAVEDFDKALAQCVDALVATATHNILVSGKKATIYELKKM